jgi:hypothetical protein
VVAYTYREVAVVDRVYPVAGMRFGGTVQDLWTWR